MWENRQQLLSQSLSLQVKIYVLEICSVPYLVTRNNTGILDDDEIVSACMQSLQFILDGDLEMWLLSQIGFGFQELLSLGTCEQAFW